MNLKTILLILVAAVFFVSCGDGAKEGMEVNLTKGQIELISDKSQLRSDGNDAVTFTVTLTDENGEVTDVTAKAEIYLDKSSAPLSGNKYSTDKDGDHVFYAIYGLSLSSSITITAFNDVPELPADPQENGTSFSHRMLLVQHTGATCSNCPRMMNSLRDLADDEAYKSLYCHVASHSYNDGERDAAYSEAARNLSMAFNTSGLYPMLTFNLTSNAVGTDLSEIKGQIDALKKDKADAGIAAAAKISGKDIVVNVEVKAAKANSYRVAAWVLEDNIYSLQEGMSEAWHNYHNNAVRYMAGTVSQFSFVGDRLGSLSSGEKASKVFVMPMDESWVASNCKVLVFVTAEDANGNYDIANCAVCPLDGVVEYDYK